ncbi:hypothetical protein LCGC14_1239530 [marine sediment metagenome]|uniref:Uncharacterized protein n=1 Tax=marine sediment metagenome TaxID=412755 RepID=A0A0F9LAE1_9ZZZZ
MASISDIPHALLFPKMSSAFVQWILNMPVPVNTRITLARKWERFTYSRLSTDQWITIGKTRGA